MDYFIMIIAVASFAGLLLFVMVSNDAGIPRDYHCRHCMESPLTYVPMQMSPPICHRCGKLMEEYNYF